MSNRPHVVHQIERVSSELVEAMAVFSSATVLEAYGGRGALPPHIRPIGPGMRICAPVVPVVCRPGDNLIVHKAIYTARPGDALLVDADGFQKAGFWGDIMTVAAQARGLTGLVTDGAVRDSQDIVRKAFPVFSAGLCIRGTTKACTGWINYPLAFHGVQVCPGDLLKADEDGVVIVSHEDLPKVLEGCRRREEKEETIRERLRNGATTLELYGFDAALERIGVVEE